MTMMQVWRTLGRGRLTSGDLEVPEPSRGELLVGVEACGVCRTDHLPPLDYQQHLFRERTLTTVTSNTRADGAELFLLAGRLGIHAEVTPYAMREADRALADLAADRVRGVVVLDQTR